MLKINRKGQSLIEYTTLIVITIAVFITIGNYFKRGVQGRWKEGVDQMGDQYDPRTAVTDILHTINSQTTTTIKAVEVNNGFWTNRQDVVDSRETKKGNSIIGAY